MRKKLLKVIKILVLSILVLVLLTTATMYFSLNEDTPNGISGPEADKFAKKIENAIQHKAYLNTKYLQWTFRNKNHYTWNKFKGEVEVQFDDYKVLLDLNNTDQSIVYHNNNEISDSKRKKIIKKAFDNFNNDSFWVVGPHKLFDKGTMRKLVILEDQTKALLVSYSSGGTTPGDSYLWKVDQNYVPTSYKMWVSMYVSEQLHLLRLVMSL